MNRRIDISLVLGAALVLSGGVARAQEPPHPSGRAMIQGGEPGGDFVAPSLGDRIELLYRGPPLGRER